MTGNIITKFSFFGPSNDLKKYLADKGIRLNTSPSECSDDYESEIEIEIVDGSTDSGNREINRDMVFAVNMSELKLKTYTGSSCWFCFENIETMFGFTADLYLSWNCYISQVEFSFDDLEICLSSYKSIFRTIKKTNDRDTLGKGVFSLMAFRYLADSYDSMISLSRFCDQIEKLIPKDAHIVYSSTLPYDDVKDRESFYFTEKMADIKVFVRLQEERWKNNMITAQQVDIPEFLKK